MTMVMLLVVILRNSKDRLSPPKVQEKMRILKNFEEAKRIKKEIFQIMKDNLFDKRIKQLKAEIQELAKDSGIDMVSHSVDRISWQLKKSHMI